MRRAILYPVLDSGLGFFCLIVARSQSIEDREQDTATPKKKKGYNTWHYRQGTYPAGDILFIMNNRALSWVPVSTFFF